MGASLLKNVQYSTFIGEPKEHETSILRNPLYAKRELSQKWLSAVKLYWNLLK